MTQRERYLAIAVGVVVTLFGAQYLFNKLSSTLREKQDAVDMARSESSDLDKTTTSGKIAARKIEKLASKSLPTNQETLVAQYRDWLTELGNEVSMDGIKVTVPDRAIKTTDAYSAYDFTLQGICRTDRALELLGMFYDKDYLHSIKGLKMTLLPKRKDHVNVQLDARALALQGASPKQEPSVASSGRLAMSLDEYKQVILDRNMFSPPNKAPKFATSKTHTIERGKPWELELEADDPESHSVSYELLSDELPEGLRFRGKRFSWRPKENGDYEVLIGARDSGWPSQSTEQKLVFRVVDPKVEEQKPEPPKFDAASQAFVSALLSGRSGPEVWIRSPTDGQIFQLQKGADFELGTIKAKVVDINLKEDFVELESDGAHWTVGMNSFLSEAYQKSQVD